MVTPISETQARSALLREMSEASNPNYFGAKRRDHGWVFGWRNDRGPIPIGTHSWAVADNCRVQMLGFTDLSDEVISGLLIN